MDMTVGEWVNIISYIVLMSDLILLVVFTCINNNNKNNKPPKLSHFNGRKNKKLMFRGLGV